MKSLIYTAWLLLGIVFGSSSVNPLSAQTANDKPIVLTNKARDQLLGLDIKEVTTAKEYLEAIFDTNSWILPEPKLSSLELQKVKQTLRTKFPLVSIRARLKFQGTFEHDTQAAKPMDWRNRYGRAMQSLHSQQVEQFIQEPGNGIYRVRPINPKDLMPYPNDEYARDMVPQPVDSSLLAEPLVPLDKKIKMVSGRLREPSHDFKHIRALSPNGMPKQQLLSRFNENSVRLFGSRTGFVKNLDEVAGFEPHRIRLKADWKREISTVDKQIKWTVNRFQLVGLLMHQEPRVYLSEQLPNMEQLSKKDIETRQLNAFEIHGLKTLSEGENLAVSATSNRIVMLGAIRAESSCLRCHNKKEGALLGAFSYEFLRSPRQPLKHKRDAPKSDASPISE